MNRARRRLLLALLMLAGAITFTLGIGWGLPSRSVDQYLFGGGPSWSGAQIQQLGGDWRADELLTSYMELEPLPPSNVPVALNDTAQQEAKIIRRYRLYSYHPDEMNNFRALGAMTPRRWDFDPKLYHYGGLWIYPVGAAVGVASVLHLVTLTTDLPYYYDHPEAFARFYVIARLLSVAWSLLGVWAVFTLASRFASGGIIPALAALSYIAMPVVINGAHTAKPHAAAAVSMLCAVLAGTRWVDIGRWRWALATGALCGAAAGVVLWGFIAVAIPCVMVLLRPAAWSRRIQAAAAAGAAMLVVFFATNPYVAVHLLGDRTPLQSNVAIAFWFNFPHSVSQMLATPELVAQATSPALAVAGSVSALLLALGAWRRHAIDPAALLLAVPAILLIGQFLWFLGGGEPDQGRFVAFPGVALGIAAAVGVGRLVASTRARLALGGLVVAATASYGVPYVMGFLDDSANRGSRPQVAARLASEERRLSGAKAPAAGAKPTLGLYGQPAPYDAPAVDLAAWKVVLLPGTSFDPHGSADVVLSVDEDYRLRPGATPLSWANVRFNLRALS